MKIVIAKKDLASLVSAVASSAAKKSSQVALTRVMIVATESGITLTATDLFTGVRARGSASVEEPGGVLVPAAELVTAIKALPDGDVKIAIDGNRLRMQVGKSKQGIAWSPLGDYPDLPQMDPAQSVGVAASTLLLAIGAVAHSISSDETRQNLCGVHIEFGGGRCRAIAANGPTLARRDAESSIERFSVLVPGISVGPVRNALERAKSDTVNVAAHDGYLFVEHGNVAMSAKLSGEMFPKDTSDKIIASVVGKHVIRAARVQLLDAVTRVRSQDGGMPIAFAISDGTIALLAKCENGDASDSVDVDYAGEAFTIGFNAPHICAALAAMTADDIVISCDGPFSAAKLTHASGDECLQIVMPARLA